MSTSTRPRHDPPFSSRLAIGPLNVAGQGFQWAEASTANLGIPAFSFASRLQSNRRLNGLSHRGVLHHRLRPTFVKETWAKLLLRDTSHLLGESLTTITGDQRRDDLTRDLDWLGERGIDVAVVFHGSDIRSPSHHLENEPSSFFTLMPADMVAALEKSTARRRRLARESALPLYVSTPDLLLDLPEATWLPLVIDPGTWRQEIPAFSGAEVRVLHLPSRRVPPIKGTSYIDPVLTRLARSGEVEYLSPESLPHEKMPSVVGSVDIVIDQLLTGSYGVAAIEAMAAGRLVVGNVNQAVRDRVGATIPIVDSTPDALEDLIRTIAADPARYAETAARGPAFVAEFHSGTQSAAALRGWLTPGDPDPASGPPAGAAG